MHHCSNQGWPQSTARSVDARFASALPPRWLYLSALAVALSGAVTLASPAPPLQAQRAGTNVILSWANSASNFVLEAADTLGQSNGWVTLSAPPYQSGVDFEVSLPIASGGKFYRLSERFNFYGKTLRFLKLFGQTRWGDTSPGRVTGAKIFHSAGLAVDRSSTPNHLYVVDSGNNRVLGFRSDASTNADLVFGQPDWFSGAANGDGNLGFHGPTTRTNLCLLNYPENPNVAEQWMRLNIDVDAAGNLYVPDFYNNRVLVYLEPFSEDTSGGRGDTIPDRVLGQENWSSNQINHGLGANARDARSLFIGWGNPAGFDHVSARGASADGDGNVWVADTFNSRVLRFPPGASVADLVLGQANFTARASACSFASNPTNGPLNRLCTPVLARINPDTGELYVVDEFPGGFPARLLVFAPPFSNGMAAARQLVPRQRLAGDYAGGYRFTHGTGLAFNPFKSDERVEPGGSTNRYRDGVLWLQANDARTLLLDATGEILLAVGAPDVTSRGGDYADFGACGQDPLAPYNLLWPGGGLGFDSANNIYLADETTHRVARFALPYRYGTNGTNRCLPNANGGMFGSPNQIGGPTPNTVGPANFHQDRVGVLAFREQLIVRDHQRYMVWTNYLGVTNGTPAHRFIGQLNGFTVTNRNVLLGRAMHAIDHANRLWTVSEHSKLMLYQLPLLAGAQPLRQLIPLFWADDPNTQVNYSASQPVAFDPVSRNLWVYDTGAHRLLRVSNPDSWSGKLLVDAVLGQTNKTATSINRGRGALAPDAASFGDVNDIKFDGLGNLFVVDNTYELHANGRILGFLAADLGSIATMFPSIQAKRVYVVNNFTNGVNNRVFWPGQNPQSPVCVAFNSRHEMVVGNDGYFPNVQTRGLNQLYLYRTPLSKPTPDAVIELPMGAPGELAFDEHDNLIVQDHIYNKVWVLNYELDPAWLRTLP